MMKIIFILIVSVTLFGNSNSFTSNFAAEVNETLKGILSKWENKQLKLGVGCAQQLYQVLENMISFDDGLWAYKMIDATGKLPSGLAEGNLDIMGSFEECLNTKSDKKNITGNYCSITVDISGIDPLTDDKTQSVLLTDYKRLKKNHGADAAGQPVASIPILGVCLPNKCSADDISNVLQSLATIIPLDIKCQTKDEVIPPLDTGAIAMIAVFGITISLMLFSTTYDVICQKKQTKPQKILIAFSAYTNGQKLFRMNSAQGELSCLHGIRFFSMCWVIIGHIFIANVLGPAVNLFEMLGYLHKMEGIFFLNCAFAVDSFFVLSGLLVSYNFMKKRKKGEDFNIFKYYLHRYLRLTPAYAVVIFSSMYLIKYLGSGPLYYKIDTMVAQLCRDHWWKALIYLQNYLADAADICVSQSWNLNIDWQLYLISPLLLFLLYKTPKFGTFMTILPIVGCMTAGFVITYKKELATVLVNGNTTMFMTYYYLKTHTRAATWFIGAYLGYVLGRINFFNDRSHLRIINNRWIVLIIWLVVLVVMPVCVLACRDMVISDEYDVAGNALYNTFARPAWALCISWVIFACTLGYGGIINDFLSLPIFGLLSKFTYSMYLLHLTILYMMVCARKIPAYFSVPEMLNQFCSLFAISFGLAIFWILAFEMPVLIIEPYIFGNWGKSPKKKPQVPTATNIQNNP